jgi:presequence protease
VELMEMGRYPVRDPFFKMLPRSLQNFMNAFTSADYTMYPFATTNAQDFKNLMDVYLDATLHPLLKHSDFVQEGWRVGPENPQGETELDKNLIFKGVVYNEMKGQMSDAQYLFYIRFMEHVYPSLNNSGGDPQCMTDLTYDQLKDFHKAHYNPSNSKILTYGDQPVEDHLEMLGHHLQTFSSGEVDADVKLPISLSGGSQNITMDGPVDPLTPPDAQYKTSTTWLMGDTTNIPESFALQIAASLLLDGYGSPMYRALIEAGLGTDFTPNTGYDTSGRRGIFSIGLNGVSEENVSKVAGTISATIENVLSQGFDKHKVEGILHQLELGLKHKSSSFGMNLIQRLKPGWFNGIDPFDALAWNSIVEGFKSEYAKGGYLEALVKRYVNNANTLTFTMVPNKHYGEDNAMEEVSRLEGKIMDTVKQFPSEEEAHKHLLQREVELLEEQTAGQSQSLDSLPTLHVEDIPRRQKPVDIRQADLTRSARLQWRETATNGLTYFRALSLFEDLPDELRMLVPLFCDSLMRIGTKTKSMEEIEDLIKLKTGGISFGYHTSTSPHDINKAEEGLGLVGHAFDRNVPAMYDLFQMILLETDFDSANAHKMVRQLLQTNASGAVDAIAASGHSYARYYAMAGLTPQGRMIEQTAGLTQVELVTRLASAEDNPEAMAELISKLKAIQTLVVANLNMKTRLALTCGTEATAENEKSLERFLSTMSAAKLSPPVPQMQGYVQARQDYPPGKTFFNFPYQVYYSALAFPTGPYTDSSSAPFAILAKLLTHNHLHHEIREKGGAYGGGAFSGGNTGFFGMYSYRDPAPENTLRIMAGAGKWAADREWTDRELEEAKLAVFQAVDAPLDVNAEGMTKFLSGIDQDMEQRRREWLLDVNKDQVRTAAEKLDARATEANVVLIGQQKDFVKESAGWRIEDMGMAAPDTADEAAVAV